MSTIEENIERGWADIEGFPGYRITVDGRVLTCHLKYNKWSKKIMLGDTWKERKPEAMRKGYLRLRLTNERGLKGFKVHRLVAMYFIENPNNKPQVNHKNGITSDNRAENLEWNTASENLIHSFRVLNRNRARGEKQGSSKLNELIVYEIKRRLALRESQYKLAKEFGIHQVTVSSIKLGRLWAHVEYP